MKIVYDNAAIYIGAYLYDQPSLVRKQMTSRDAEQRQDVDYFAVFLDTYHDKQTGFQFLVTSRNVVANRTFQATNTFWVDPRTGVPVNVEERILSTLHAPGGQGRLMVANADLTMTSASQRALAAVARQNAAAITIVRQEGPLGGLLLGLLLLLAGTVSLRRLQR